MFPVFCLYDELSEGWQLCLSTSFSSYLQEATVGGEKLCLATAGSLFFMYILGLAKHLYLSSSQISSCNISWLDFFKSQPKYRILCDHCSLTSNLLKLRLWNMALTVVHVHAATYVQCFLVCWFVQVCELLWTGTRTAWCGIGYLRVFSFCTQTWIGSFLF